jgi:hypothetical protein
MVMKDASLAGDVSINSDSMKPFPLLLLSSVPQSFLPYVF